MVLVVKNLPASARDARDIGLIPGLGRPLGEGNGNLPQDPRQRSLAGYSPWGHKESDMTEQLSTHTNIYIASAITEHFPQWLR